MNSPNGMAHLPRIKGPERSDFAIITFPIVFVKLQSQLFLSSLLGIMGHGQRAMGPIYRDPAFFIISSPQVVPESCRFEISESSSDGSLRLLGRGPFPHLRVRSTLAHSGT